MPIVSDVKLIGKQYNIETYTAKLTIIIKKIITNNINEASLYQIKLLENKKYRKIYDIIIDKNILYVYMAPEENIDDLLCAKIKKEAITDGHSEPIEKSVIL